MYLVYRSTGTSLLWVNNLYYYVHLPNFEWDVSTKSQQKLIAVQNILKIIKFWIIKVIGSNSKNNNWKSNTQKLCNEQNFYFLYSYYFYQKKWVSLSGFLRAHETCRLSSAIALYECRPVKNSLILCIENLFDKLIIFDYSEYPVLWFI